ncbi:PTS-dependent dihydroxyacetone kinase phosphotransferase subunit DhaM [Mycoplasmopsis agassizii]|uniref:PTS EIIA type-4 domain-containing protein n=1 Tax=Mycoplasmopsis agassizii TaxID=33922 RepID=A0ABX4H6B7_9BACT|nr:hypothetical protein [Mycoplasmopsis agassizii]PAF55429.1 hypothetical protein CJF60_01965 [Mycoplasmopsis agassizii]SMC18402.1 PTS-EIIA-like component DhaM of the dihydroxyacetone kinase DhaKLM complex [Mycoplasmopsis agassizii]
MHLVIVTHSYSFTEHIIKYLKAMIPDLDLAYVHNASGLDETIIGTSPMRILDTINEVSDQEIILAADLGSSMINSALAQEMIDDKKIHLVKGPFLESLFSVSSLLNSGIEFNEMIKICDEIAVK